MTERLAILGMRLAPSLHLGHYIGNISPALSIVDNAQIVVILADLATFASQREKDLSKKNAIALVADCMATGLTSEQVLFALQSQIAVETNVLQSIIGNMISFAQLSRIQPIRAMLSSKNNKVTASAVTFPLIEASEAIALKADYLISNVDNLGVVSLIRHI